MLLAVEKTIVSAEHSSIGFVVWESNPGLLQEDWIAEEKSIDFKRKIRACDWGFKVCITKLWAFETVLKGS